MNRRQESWRIGQVVAARWSDDCWYRGQVVNMKQGKLEIFFVDFGNTEKVDKEDVGGLASEFCSLDCQAVRVKLDGLDADMDNLDDDFTKYLFWLFYSVVLTGSQILLIWTFVDQFIDGASTEVGVLKKASEISNEDGQNRTIGLGLSTKLLDSPIF